MESKLQEPHPEVNMPYKDDLCNRSESGRILKQIVDTFSDGCVISLNGKWGSGKTTLLKMWKKQMETLEYKVIHFNAWENDYTNDPLIGIIAEFKEFADKVEKEKLDSLLMKFGKVSLSMLPAILCWFLKYKTGYDIKDIIEKGSDEFIVSIKEYIDEYSKQKNAIKTFRDELTKYVECLSPQKPLIFIIDELDRCNPSYAVKTLERIKHIFAVRNIVFVIAVDELQLCNSIKGYYGSEQFDAKDYLRRFFDIQYDLPQANVNDLLNAAMSRFGFKELYNDNNKYRQMYDFLLLLYLGKNLSIRSLEKLLLNIRLSIGGKNELGVDDTTIAFLIYLKLFESDCYEKFIHYQMSENEFIKYIESHFNDAFFDMGNPSSMYYFNPAVAELLMSRYPQEFYEDKIIDKDGNLRFKIEKFSLEHFPRAFQHFGRKQYPRLDKVLKSLTFVNFQS